jgi:peptidoglycan/LPS O-acetylase OafA/YrhL
MAGNKKKPEATTEISDEIMRMPAAQKPAATELAPSAQNRSASRDLTGRIPELDGFRAIAVWMVLVFHLTWGWPLPNGALDALPAPLLFIIAKGWLGVDLFFVLSGLLITGILLDSKEKPHYFRTFYGRRFLRIIPLYFAVIAVCFAAYRQPAGYFVLSFCFLANFASAFRVATPHGPGVFWSLAVEEHFYLAWPLMVRFLSRRRLAVVCLVIFCGSAVLRGVAVAHGMDPEIEVYPRSWFRFDGLALGALLAIFVRSRYCSRRTSLGMAGLMLFLSLLIVAAGAPFGVLGTKTVASTAVRYTHMQLLFGSGILTALTLSGSRLTAFLRMPFMRVSSDLSYCIYLIHLSVGDGYHWLLSALKIDVAAAFGPRGAWLAQFIMVLGVTFGLAFLSKKYLEDPCLRLKRYFRYS